MLIAGAGKLTRRTSRHLGAQLAARGIAALVMDKRGTGRSQGNFADAKLSDFSRDAIAAFSFLRERPEVDAGRIGIIATSEGGLLAPAVVRAHADIAFMVCRVCPVAGYSALMQESAREELQRAGASEDDMRNALHFLDMQSRYAIRRTDYDSLARLWSAGRETAWAPMLGLGSIPPPRSASWDRFRDLLLSNPGRMYSSLNAPVLMLFGDQDPVVQADVHAARANWIFSRGRSADWTVKVVPNADHGLLRVDLDEEGKRLPVDRYAGDWQEDLLGWVSARVFPQDVRSGR